MKHITINSDRSVTVPVELRKIGVQYDHNVNTIEFVGPRYSGNVDLSTMTIYINYILSDKTPGKYKAENVIIDDQDNSLIRFNWTITRNVTKVSGILSCLICAKKTDEEGNEINHWNTDIFRLLSVSEGMENDLVIQEQYPDVITSIMQNIEEHNAKLLKFSGLNIRVTDLENNVEELKGDIDKSVNKYSVTDSLKSIINTKYNDVAFNVTQYPNAGGYVWFSSTLEFFENPTNITIEFDVKCTNKITKLNIINTLTSDEITIRNITGIEHIKYDVVGMSSATIEIKIRLYGGTLPFDIHFTNLVVNKKLINNPTFTILEGTGTKESIDKEFVKFVDYNDFYDSNEIIPTDYVTGKFTNKDKTISSDGEFRYCEVAIPKGLKKIGLSRVWIGGNIGIWLKKDNAIIDVITKTSMGEYYEEIDVTNYDSIVFSTKTTTKTKVIYLDYKQSKYVSKEELKSNVLDVVIPNENIGFTTPYNTIAVDNSYKYSNWLKVKGGEKIKIYHALMTNSAVVQMSGVFETSYYSLSEIGEDKTFEFVLPDNVTHIRYSVANRFVNTTKVEYVSDYAEFTNDFIPALYTNAMPSRHDKPIITFVDDDGRNEYLTVLKPVFDNHGVKGTIAMIVSNVGTNPNFLTLEQLNSLKNDGYDIVSHTYSHSESIFNPLQNTGVTEEQIYNDLVTARRWLDDNGFNSECLIFPWGSYGNKKGKFIHQAIKAGYQFSCNATGQSNNGSVINTYWLDRPFILDSRDLNYYKNLIDSCIKSNGWLILSTHCYNVTEMPNTELLESILDYIQEKGVDVMTFKDASSIKKNICSIGWLEDKSNKLYIGRDGKIYN